MGGYVSHETRTSVRYFLGAIPLPHLAKIRIPAHISHQLTTDKSHNQAIYEGRGVFTSTIENTSHNHLPSPTNRIVSYIYTNSNLLTYHHQLPLTKSPYLPINTTLLP